MLGENCETPNKKGNKGDSDESTFHFSIWSQSTLGHRLALEVVVVKLVAIGFEREVVAPVVHELRVVDLPVHCVPSFVVRHGEPVAFRGLQACGGFINEFEACVVIGLVATHDRCDLDGCGCVAKKPRVNEEDVASGNVASSRRAALGDHGTGDGLVGEGVKAALDLSRVFQFTPPLSSPPKMNSCSAR